MIRILSRLMPRCFFLSLPRTGRDFRQSPFNASGHGSLLKKKQINNTVTGPKLHKEFYKIIIMTRTKLRKNNITRILLAPCILSDTIYPRKKLLLKYPSY